MVRTFLLILGAGCLAVAACSRHKAAPEPKQEAVNPQPAAPVTTATPVAPTTKTSPAATATNTPSAASSRLSDLATAFLVSDGRGGWRKDEKAATELEKLSSEETSQIWPLLKDSQANIRRGAAVFLVAQFDESNSQQIEAFTALLGDGDAFVRARGLDAARQFLAADKIAALPKVAPLLEAAHEERAENRAAAVRLCGAMKKDANGVLPAIEKAAIADPDAKVARPRQRRPSKSPIHKTWLQCSKKYWQIKIPRSGLSRRRGCGNLAATQRQRRNELAAALADSDKNVAEAAAEALIRMGSPAVEPLAAQLSGNSLAGTSWLWLAWPSWGRLQNRPSLKSPNASKTLTQRSANSPKSRLRIWAHLSRA